MTRRNFAIFLALALLLAGVAVTGIDSLAQTAQETAREMAEMGFDQRINAAIAP